MYQYWLIICLKFIILMEDANNRGNWVWDVSSQFFYKFKGVLSLLKNKACTQAKV